MVSRTRSRRHHLGACAIASNQKGEPSAVSPFAVAKAIPTICIKIVGIDFGLHEAVRFLDNFMAIALISP